jgi:dUTP pyrophosphatase
VYVLPTSKPPMKKRASDGGFDFYIDLHSSEDVPSAERIALKPGEVKKLSTGCYCQFPEETVWQWDVRSSVGLKGIDVTCRTIDSAYRGLLHVVVVNNSNANVFIEHGDRLAQLVCNPFSSNYTLKQVSSVEELGKSERGARGFGSSGK